MIYRGMTTCKICRKEYEFECYTDRDERRNKGHASQPMIATFNENRMCYDYTDNNGIPHFSGICIYCKCSHTLTNEEALQVPEIFYR